MVKVLVLCRSGNTRSQALTYFIRELARQQGVKAVVRSAGVNRKGIRKKHQYQRKHNVQITPDPRLAAMLQTSGLTVTTFPPHLIRAKMVTQSQLEWADIILVPEPKILTTFIEQFPRFRNKARIITHYVREQGLPKELIEKGLKGDFWQPGKPNPIDYELGVKRGTPEAKRLLLEKAKLIAEATVRRWKVRPPFITPRQRKDTRKLQRKHARK